MSARRGLLFESTDGHRRFLVEPGQRVVIGRRPPPSWEHVRIESVALLPEHARLAGDHTAVTVEDLGGASGTFVDGRRIGHGVRVWHGAAVHLGGVTLNARSFIGEDLGAMLSRSTLSIDDALAIAADLLGALASLHGAGAYHGALTPGEILRAVDGALALLIRDTPTLGPGGAVLGNPRYIAPEVIRGGPFEAAGDVHAVGLIIYEAIAGRSPFDADSIMDELAAKLRGAPAWPPAWPRPLRDWIGALLTPDPVRRPTAAQALELLATVRG